MKVIELLELDENAKILNKEELKNINELPAVINSQKDFNSSGQWVVLDELVDIDNQYLVNFQDEKTERTWIKLPESYVEEDYLINYKSDDQCPLGVDVLIKEDGYSIGVIKGCDSIKQAKVDNNLDGHKYKGELGITLNNKYFLNYKKEDEEFKISKTNVDWDRGRRTI